MNIFQDGFGHYDVTATQMPTKWTSAVGSILSGKPTGTTYAFQGFASKTVGLFTTLAGGYRQFCAGSKEICAFRNGSPINIVFSVEPDGSLRALVNGTNDLHSTFAITFGAVYHFQVLTQLSTFVYQPFHFNQTHTFQVYVNGVLRFSGAITYEGATWGGDPAELAYATSEVSSNDGGGGWVGDHWLTDGELLGQCPIPQSLAIADGPVTQWTPSTGSNHYPNVNTRVPTDTTYNFDSNPGDIDEYQMNPLPTGVVKGLQVVVRLEKDAPGNSTLQIVYRNAAGTTVLGTPVFAPSANSYAFFLDCNRKSVFTGLDWTVAEINGMFVGIKRVS